MQAADWSGRVGETWAREWRHTDRSFAALEPMLERQVLAAVAPQTTTAVDIGCGAGTTALAIAEACPWMSVTGIDLSPDLVEVATIRAKERGVADRCRFVVGDVGAVLDDLSPVDLFFSRHGVMFFDDPVAAFGRMREAGAPGAGLVFSCFAAVADNNWATEPIGAAPADASSRAEPGPFAFADPARVAGILSAACWSSARKPERVAYRYIAGVGDDPVRDATSFFHKIGPAARALADASKTEKSTLAARIAAACERHRDGDEVAFSATAWLWSAHLMEKLQ